MAQPKKEQPSEIIQPESVSQTPIVQPATGQSPEPQSAGRPMPIKRLAMFAAAALVLLMLGFAAVKMLGKTDTGKQPNTNTVDVKPAAEVVILNDQFVPATVKVKAGDSVSWTNEDKAQHKIASDPYPKNDSVPGLASDALNEGESFNFTFEKAGTVTYHDDLNPTKVLGTVIVE